MKVQNLKRRLLSLFLVLMMACSVPYQLPVMAQETTTVQQVESITASVPANSGCINKGNVFMAFPTEDLLAKGYEYGDVVNVSFSGHTLVVPLVSIYSDVDSGTTCLIARSNKNINLSINGGNFAESYGISEETLPMEISISMNTKAGYYNEYILHQIKYTDERSGYPNLTDAEFANFRCVTTTGMGKNILYRSASPIDRKHNRNAYTDAELKKAGVTVVMNLADTQEEAQAFPGYSGSYYSTTKQLYLQMDANFTADSFRNRLAQGFRYFAQNPGVYDVHCLEGKDRTGFVIAILECFMGATAQEVVSDYMTTYYNYYGITKDDPRYQVIANGNIVKTLQTVFKVDDLYKADLKTCATDYIRQSGLTEEEITALRDNLRGDYHTQTVVVNKKAATYKSAGYTGDTVCAICGKVIQKGKAIAKLTAKKQTIKVSKKASKKVTLRYRKLRRHSTSFKISAKANGKITYKVTYGRRKYISVSKSGKVTIRKKAKRGTYKVTVYAAATKDGKYKKATRTITIKIK